MALPRGKRKSASKHRFVKKRTPTGASPGHMAPEPGAPKPRIRVVSFGPEEMTSPAGIEPRDIRACVGKMPVTWVHCEGVGDSRTIEELGAAFGFHRLALADVVNAPQRPKGEDYDGVFFLILQLPHGVNGAATAAPRESAEATAVSMPTTSPEETGSNGREFSGMSQRSDPLEMAQMSLFLGAGYVVTIQNCPGDFFEPVRRRLEQPRTKIRTSGADYLAYALLDCVIDTYFPTLESYGDRLEALESEVISGSAKNLAVSLHDLKHDLYTIRRALWPTRDALLAFVRDESPLVTDATRLHVRDAVDHTHQLLDLVEAHHEFSSGLMTLHQAAMAQRANETMKVLTMLASVFIPLTFIVGIYGMNFDPDSSPWNMPELRWRYGYPIVMGFMAFVTFAMMIFFRRKGWLGNGE